MTGSPPENGGRTLVASASKDGSRAGWSEHAALDRVEKASGTKEEELAKPLFVASRNAGYANDLG
jgi:hypothetical protein